MERPGGSSTSSTGAGEQLSSTEAAELRRLRREVAIQQRERDFLATTAYFANPSGEVRLHPPARRAVDDRVDV